ncbi:MAG: PIN domain-containing protein [Ignavibacteriae bacterium]|nr:PIN domain-containing protein [Ignavibacteriota bacterium]
MADKIFVDSNIWLYAFMSEKSVKHDKAITIISNSDVYLNIQVINEVCYNLLKKSNYNNNEISELIYNFNKMYTIFNIGIPTLLNATSLRHKYKSSFWDSLILASALENNCNILLTEDISGADFIEKKLKVVNPFL